MAFIEIRVLSAIGFTSFGDWVEIGQNWLGIGCGQISYELITKTGCGF
jgi:hypothetical protein